MITDKPADLLNTSCKITVFGTDQPVNRVQILFALIERLGKSASFSGARFNSRRIRNEAHNTVGGIGSVVGDDRGG
jgi:hypothetical protein